MDEKKVVNVGIWSKNLPVVIPPMAIITVPNGTTIHCPEFSLPGPITPENKATINIIKNLSIIEADNELIDMHKELIANTTWDKLPYLNSDTDALMREMLAQTSTKIDIIDNPSWHNQHSGKIMITLGMGFLALSLVIILLMWYGKKTNPSKITIALPKLNA